MSDNINVKLTPIQRNTNDVAVELVQIFCKDIGVTSMEELAIAYAKCFAIAEYMEEKKLNRNVGSKYSGLIPDELNK